jgi:kindlin 2
MISSNIAPTDWELKVNIHEFDIIEHSMRVKGEMHIGGVIFQLVDKLNHIRNDWSDFALWWPDKNQWLNKTKMTLDQYGVQADALLHFTRLHKNIRVKLPDQQIVSVKIDASLNLFNGIKQICKELSIRHPEEVSLLRFNMHISTDKKVNSIKSNDSNKIQMSQSLTINSRKTSNLNNNDEIQSNKDNASLTPNSTLSNQLHADSTFNGAFTFVHDRSQSVSLEKGVNSESQTLALSPILPTQDYLFKNEMKYRNLFDKTKINSR